MLRAPRASVDSVIFHPCCPSPALAAPADSGHGDQGESTDLHAILRDGYPASSARVVAALTRRCRELQDALVEATEQLEQAQLTIEGLRQGNAKVLELSQVRCEESVGSVEVGVEGTKRCRAQQCVGTK